MVLPIQLESEQIIVAFPLVAPTLLADMARQLARQYGLIPVTDGFPLPSVGLHCAVFEIRPGQDLETQLRAISRHPGVRFAQRNQRFEMHASTHSDPYASMQHGPESIGADRAHGTATGRGVRIAVIDTGIDRAHSDLGGRIAAARNFVQGGDATFSTDAHGTAVAGVIAAGADDGIGIYGVAPGVEIVAAKACWYPDSANGGATCSSWTLALAVDYAIESRVRILNLSLGGPPDRLLEVLLTRAFELSIVTVAAAGETPSKPKFPASLATVIGVANSEFEQSAGPPDKSLLAAPGSEILTTAPGEAYGFQSGSSLSTAHVSGLVALLLERDPNLEPAEILELLGRTARRNEGLDEIGSVDACAALRAVGNGESCP